MASPSLIQNFEDFERVHGILLAASGIPPTLHRQLFRKLSAETFDGGNFFSVEPCDGGRQRRLLLSAQSLDKDSDLFLVDHAWTFRLSDALNQLMEVPGLAERMGSLMCVDLDADAGSDSSEPEPVMEVSGSEEKVLEILQREMNRVKEKGGDAAAAWLELEELGIDDEMLRSLDLSTKFPNLVALNLWGNKLLNVEVIVEELSKCGRLKAVWLNDNPVLQDHGDVIGHSILSAIPGVEIYNSCFTSNSAEWALGFCGGIFGADNPVFSLDTAGSLEGITLLDLSNRSIQSLPKALSPDVTPAISHLNLRNNPLCCDSIGDISRLLSGFRCLQVLEVDIPGPLGNSAIKIVESLPNLSLLNGVNTSNILERGKHVIDSMLQPRIPEGSSTEPLADRVISAMWLYLMTYRLADEEKIDETSVWYVMDELGSALRHSDEANFRVAPFLFMPDGKLASAISYSVLWPSQDVHIGEECTRDFLFGLGEDKQRSARLTAWFHTPENYFIQEYKRFCQKLQPKRYDPYIKPLTSISILPSDGGVLHVYTDIPQVEESLTRPEFALTNDPKHAHIIWTSLQVDAEVKTALGLTNYQFVNQFPFEACLVMKHHLAETIREAQGSPEWLQPTYNLENQLSQLIGDYCMRKQDGLDNLWILKPWNMARTIDTTVTGDLSAIIRLMETGPKICQKYIEHPALFKGKKFDLRYIVLVRSMDPVEIFLMDVFWVRLANNAYTLDKRSLFEYETHFTVMNYIGRMNHMNTPDFVREFEEEHRVNWLDIHKKIKNMIRSVFDSAAIVHPKMHSPVSRAIYGVDVMLDNLFMPKILEVTYCPDCARACKYDTKAVVGNQAVIRGCDFFNHVFGCLFLGELAHVTLL